MATYHLKAGIAAAVTVTFPDGTQETAIYMGNEEPNIVLGVGNNAGEIYKDLPQSVRNAPEEHFNLVFSYPTSERGEYLKYCNTLTVEG